MFLFMLSFLEFSRYDDNINTLASTRFGMCKHELTALQSSKTIEINQNNLLIELIDLKLTLLVMSFVLALQTNCMLFSGWIFCIYSIQMSYHISAWICFIFSINDETTFIQNINMMLIIYWFNNCIAGYIKYNI